MIPRIQLILTSVTCLLWTSGAGHERDVPQLSEQRLREPHHRDTRRSVPLEGERPLTASPQIIFGDTRQHDIGVQILTDVSVLLHDALEGNFNMQWTSARKKTLNGRKIVPGREVEHRVNRAQQLVVPSSALSETRFYNVALDADNAVPRRRLHINMQRIAHIRGGLSPRTRQKRPREPTKPTEPDRIMYDSGTLHPARDQYRKS